jgi:hypothetical protein
LGAWPYIGKSAQAGSIRPVASWAAVTREEAKMTKDQDDIVRTAAKRVIGLEEEVEASGYASIDGEALDSARAALHQWVDEITGVVISPGLGRVTVIHGDGRRSTIASSTLPFLMSKPI